MMETKDYKEGIREYDTYVFDLDGTLLSTLDDLAVSCNYALRTNGMEEHSVDDVRRFVGNGVRKLMERAIPQGEREQAQIKPFSALIFKIELVSLGAK